VINDLSRFVPGRSRRLCCVPKPGDTPCHSGVALRATNVRKSVWHERSAANAKHSLIRRHFLAHFEALAGRACPRASVAATAPRPKMRNEQPVPSSREQGHRTRTLVHPRICPMIAEDRQLSGPSGGEPRWKCV